MAWTAKITTTTKNNDGLSFNVVVEYYQDAVKRFTIPYNGLTNDTQMRRQIENQLAQYDAVDKQDIETIKGDYVPTPPPTTIPPTPEQVALNKFLKDVRILLGMQNAVTLGAMQLDDKAYTDQKALVVSEFLKQEDYFIIMSSLRVAF